MQRPALLLTMLAAPLALLAHAVATQPNGVARLEELPLELRVALLAKHHDTPGGNDDGFHLGEDVHLLIEHVRERQPLPNVQLPRRSDWAVARPLCTSPRHRQTARVAA